MYKFSIPTQFPSDLVNINKLMTSNESYSSDGLFYSECQEHLRLETNSLAAFITPSGTSALEMMAQIIEFEPGDEVILPSYTFSSTAMAFLNAGAKLVFVDVTLNDGCISTSDVISNITENTKAILAVSYGGRLENQTELYELAKKTGILYLEDNAQSIGMIGIGKGIEPISAMSCISFHSTKNINAGGEGGALLINDSSLLEKAWNIRDKGTNRQNFLSGEVSKYQWTSKGGSHILGESGCAILASQLQSVNEVNLQRQTIMMQYKIYLPSNFDKYGSFMFEVGSKTNGHISAVILENSDIRNSVIQRLKSMGISAVSHYEPLHSSPAAVRYDCRISESGCIVSTKLSKSIIRLPVYLGLLEDDVKEISDKLVDSLISAQKLV